MHGRGRGVVKTVLNVIGGEASAQTTDPGTVLR